MEWIKNPLINKSEVARQLGISPALLKFKLENTNGNRFTVADLENLEFIRASLAVALDGAKQEEIPPCEHEWYEWGQNSSVVILKCKNCNAEQQRPDLF